MSKLFPAVNMILQNLSAKYLWISNVRNLCWKEWLSMGTKSVKKSRWTCHHIIKELPGLSASAPTIKQLWNFLLDTQMAYETVRWTNMKLEAVREKEEDHQKSNYIVLKKMKWKHWLVLCWPQLSSLEMKISFHCFQQILLAAQYFRQQYLSNNLKYSLVSVLTVIYVNIIGNRMTWQPHFGHSWQY